MSLPDSPENVQPRPEPLPAEPDTALTADENQWAMFCHLSALLGLLAGGLTFIGPLICWLVKRDMSKFVDYHGKESLNFQLNILIYYLILIAITIATCGIAAIGTVPILIALGVYAIVMPIVAGLKANEGDYYEYPLTFRMIK
jgi:uncharacterized Tic20 family protein